MEEFLKRLVPEARIGVAHGQMKERELEEIMRKFFHGEIDILLSTAIVGAGLDVPRANTIIINHAERFGLADLYQLRGRVGRSNIKAYAYFLIPGEDVISDEARKKLQAIQELSFLGAGLRLAIRDLEIRGAGNLLGAEQSGHIDAVGFDTYMEMLEAEIAALKGERLPKKIDTEMDLRINALIPEEYIEDPDIRLSIYRRLISSKDMQEIEKIASELRDRFGPIPIETERLFEVMKLKVRARDLYIKSIKKINGKYRILFDPETPITPERLFNLHKTGRWKIRYLQEGGIEIDLKTKDVNGVFTELHNLIDELTTDSSILTPNR
jgi:transcription-repair coupling factor (superfamily II helicase)